MTAAELQTKVLQAIRGEKADTPSFETYDVESVRLEDVGDPTRQFLRVVVTMEEGRTLDDRLEGSWLSWSEPANGSASILVVDVMDDALILNDVRGVPPTNGARLYVPLPDFLEPLADAWAGPMAVSAALVLGWLERAVPVFSDSPRGMRNDDRVNADLCPISWWRFNPRLRSSG